jgi:hypothetical protein
MTRPGIEPGGGAWPGVVIHFCNPSSWEAEQYSKFKASLGYIARPGLKKNPRSRTFSSGGSCLVNGIRYP